MNLSGIAANLMPLFLIVVARIMDVSVGTLRVVFISRGRKGLATLCGFFEVLIWIIVISQVLSGIQHWLAYIAYAGGFALGTLIGMWLEEKIAIGWVVMRLITNKPTGDLVATLRETGFGVTVVQGQGSQGPVQIVYTMVPRKKVAKLRDLLYRFNPHAFFTIEDIREVCQIWPTPFATARTGAGKIPMP